MIVTIQSGLAMDIVMMKPTTKAAYLMGMIVVDLMLIQNGVLNANVLTLSQ